LALAETVSGVAVPLAPALLCPFKPFFPAISITASSAHFSCRSPTFQVTRLSIDRSPSASIPSQLDRNRIAQLCLRGPEHEQDLYSVHFSLGDGEQPQKLRPAGIV